MKMQANPRTPERGSAIFWIIIMIFLFAALTMVMSQGTRSGGAQLTKEQASLAATEIVNYGSAMRGTVHELRINGCAETQISFESAQTGTDYQNNNAPDDESCHVFSMDGGGVKYLLFPTGTNHDGEMTDPGFSAGMQVEGVGTSDVDLLMQIPNLDVEVCMKINDLLGVSNPGNAPPLDGNSVGNILFTGSYGSPVVDGIGDDGGHDLPGKKAFCRNKGTLYQFVQVLIAR